MITFAVCAGVGYVAGSLLVTAWRLWTEAP